MSTDTITATRQVATQPGAVKLTRNHGARMPQHSRKATGFSPGLGNTAGVRGFQFPQTGISTDETGVCDFKQSSIPKSRSLVPVSRIRFALVALLQKLKSTRQHVKPRDGDVCCLVIEESQTAKLEQVCCRRKAEIEIDAVTKAFDNSAIEGPDSSSCCRDVALDRLSPDPSVNVTMLGAPGEIADNAISELSRNFPITEDCGTFKSPSSVVSFEPTCVVPRGVEPSPKNRNCDHSRFPRAVG